jgi:hypothetical protein
MSNLPIRVQAADLDFVCLIQRQEVRRIMQERRLARNLIAVGRVAVAAEGSTRKQAHRVTMLLSLHESAEWTLMVVMKTSEKDAR